MLYQPFLFLCHLFDLFPVWLKLIVLLLILLKVSLNLFLGLMLSMVGGGGGICFNFFV